MTRLLGLDLGMARTGVAFADDSAGFVMALNTVQHRSTKELIDAVQKIILEKKIERIIVGLPLLPGGMEGEQVDIVRSVASEIEQATKLPIIFLDERYTSKILHKDLDKDAKAACDMLSVYTSKST